MLHGIRSRLSYANVIATCAMFVALGGGAYALSGVPDRSGVYHGCVDAKSGALRVVAKASSCRKTKTVRRGTRRVRIPGESAIAWNQQGLRGLQGAQGLPGAQGTPGPTFAAVGNTNGIATDPSASPDEVSLNPGRHFAFTLPAAGNVYVRFFTPAIGLSCSSGNGNAGLYLDGAPLPKTGEPNAAAPHSTEFVAVAAAAAGLHVAEVRDDCPAGTITGGVENATSKWTVLLLGA
jgi:hypothetical protein